MIFLDASSSPLRYLFGRTRFLMKTVQELNAKELFCRLIFSVELCTCVMFVASEIH